jgi:hypothetical protein
MLAGTSLRTVATTQTTAITLPAITHLLIILVGTTKMMAAANADAFVWTISVPSMVEKGAQPPHTASGSIT